MIQCPQCKATLPDWADHCQFCNTSTRAVARPIGVPTQSGAAAISAAPNWIWPSYYIMATLIVLQGVFPLVAGIVLATSKEAAAFGFMATIPIIVGIASIAVGVGLIAKIEIVRGIANVFCWISIAVGVLGLFGNIMAALAGIPAGFAGMLSDIVQIGSAGFMIYLLSATDQYGW